jgi:hypothetical protein
VASFSCVGYDDNKALSHKAIGGGKMRIGDLVRIRQSYSQKKIGKLAIVVNIWQGINVTIHIVDTGKEEDFHIKKLEVV